MPTATAAKAKPEAKRTKRTPRTSDASTIAVDPVRAGWKVFTYAVGLRDAFANGCAIAIPTGPNELGWAMDDTRVTDL